MAIFIARAVAGSDSAVPQTYGPDFFTGNSYDCNDSSKLHFTDVPISSSYCKHVHYLWARGMLDGCQPNPPAQFCPNDNVFRLQMAKFLAAGFQLGSDPAALRRYSFYTPELNLLAESEFTSAAKPAIFYEYIWFNGQPVAQVDAGTSTHWTFTDHLGTPLRQFDASAGPRWRAEYEPYGANLFGAVAHQPLRFPGQEVEDIGFGGGNGITERSYNIFRWYRYNWGRYTQNDPEPRWWLVHPEPYGYVRNNPIQLIDRLGLYAVAGNCSLTGLDVARGIRDLCSSKTLPGTKCSRALENISAAIGGGTNLNRCFQQSCQGSSVVVQCDPCFGKCAQTSAGFGVSIITIGGGNSGCPNNRGLGLGETLLHETLHVCAFGNPATDEPHLPGNRAAWFRYAEDACYGWRDPNSPPFGPPQ
jgi:RHS repeat-associated protein